MMKQLVLAWWFTFALTDATGSIVQQGERGPYDTDIACERRRSHFIATMQPRLAAQPKASAAKRSSPGPGLEVSACDSDKLDKMPR